MGAEPDIEGKPRMDLDAIDAVEFGQSLKGLGVNLLVKDVPRSVAFLTDVLGMQAFQPTADFAILRSGTAVLQVHADRTYHSNPLPQLLPESGARGGGAELRLYDVDPDAAFAKALAHEGATVLQDVKNKPHGLREAYILDPDGYCWVPSRSLNDAETKALDA